MPETRRILVFNERGADSRVMSESLRMTFMRAALKGYAPKVDIVPVTAGQMREPGMFDPARTIGFVLPGASHADYDTKLGADNIIRLRKFVQGGGRFLGVCAGAYYVCRSLSWYAWDADTAKHKKPGIDFFNHHAHGPIRDFIHDDLSLAHSQRTIGHIAAAEIITDKGSRTKLLYWGGPQLQERPEDTVLARFNTLAGKPPAIVQRDLGKGRALISSVHPEIPAAELALAIHGDTPLHDRARRAAEALVHEDSGRRIMWHKIMHRLFPEYIPAR